jgi:putative SOS response-associated peptidase YedK
MCNRYTQTDDVRLKAYWREVFGIAKRIAAARYNIPPSDKDPLPVAAMADGVPAEVDMLWGFNFGRLITNARCETVTTLPAFKGPSQEHRCLFIVDGMYEWDQKTEPRIPHFYRLKGGEPFAVPALFRPGKDKHAPRFVTLTTEPNSLITPISMPRMSAMLTPDGARTWLRPGPMSQEEINRLCSPYPADGMETWEVSRYVSRAGNEGADCIEPASRKIVSVEKPDGEQLSLL